jgi:hypothetical protein
LIPSYQVRRQGLSRTQISATKSLNTRLINTTHLQLPTPEEKKTPRTNSIAWELECLLSTGRRLKFLVQMLPPDIPNLKVPIYINVSTKQILYCRVAFTVIFLLLSKSTFTPTATQKLMSLKYSLRFLEKSSGFLFQ